MASLATGVPLSNNSSFNAIQGVLANLPAPSDNATGAAPIGVPASTVLGDNSALQDIIGNLPQPVGGATGAGESTTQLNPVQQVHADIFQSIGDILSQFLGGGSTSGTQDSGGSVYENAAAAFMQSAQTNIP